MTRRELAVIPSFLASQGVSAEVVSLGSWRELLIDEYLIAEMRGAELRLAPPIAMGPVLALDRPWEGPFSGYSTLIQDRDRRLLYYRGLPAAGRDGSDNEVTCVAESRDGLRWTRPDLTLFPLSAAPVNNVVLAARPPFSHNFTPFLDTRPGVPAGERFKAIAGIHRSGLWAFASADGLRWTPLRSEPVFPSPEAFTFDSQNIAFWSALENCYVLYYRSWKKVGGTNYRWVSRATSPDCLVWTPAGEMDYGGAPPEHLYTNQTSIYPRAPHIFTGICARFFPGRQVLTDEQARRVKVDPKYYQDCSDAVLVTSRGGTRYSRTFMEAFLRPGPGLENWASRSNYPALNLMQTGPTTMSFLVNRNYGQPSAHLERYELRLDGFASAHAGYRGGQVLTRPLTFDGETLELNYSTSAAGSVRVELLDRRARPLPGFTLAEAPDLIGDEIDGIYRWRSQVRLGGLRAEPVRLRFHLKDADIFAFRFR